MEQRTAQDIYTRVYIYIYIYIYLFIYNLHIAKIWAFQQTRKLASLTIICIHIICIQWDL